MRIPAILLAAACATAVSLPAFGDDEVRNSVVKIHTTIQPPDLASPWRKQAAYSSGGSGVVIEGRRILTNSHVIEHAIEVTVQPEHSTEKLAATVEAFAPGVDLAVLKLEDESFFDTHRPLVRSGTMPRIQDAVAVYGYPVGGSALSITRGIVSRIEYGHIWHGTWGLVLQVDAAINPGNSGGPVLSGDKMVGLAFSGLSRAQNIGYLISCEEIELFLKDIADGRYHGKPELLEIIKPMENPAACGASSGSTRKTTGVLVTGTGGPEGFSTLRRGDVITRIGEHALDNVGMVSIDGVGLIDFHYLVPQLARDNKVTLTILREGRELPIDVPVGRDRNQWLVPELWDVGGRPSYFVYGPLVFTEPTREFVRDTLNNTGVAMTLAQNGNPLSARLGDRPAFDGERLVTLGEPVFPHKIVQGYRRLVRKVVGEVNGVRVRNLKHLVEIVRDARGEYVEITFLTNIPEVVVFRREEALRATEDVLSNNGIRNQLSPDLVPVWKAK